MDYRVYGLFIVLLLPVLAHADGCAFGDGFSQQLSETHQLAVIKLTETTADVSMFIAIEGIPSGQELTYLLPFWYKPDGFSLQEDTASNFRDACVAPAHEEAMRMQRIVFRNGSEAVKRMVPIVATGLPALLYDSTIHAGEKGRGVAASALLTPYATDETPHASAELFNIGGHDLQQLLKQSGLPEKYLKPLKKYRTPYFAVMRLKGLANSGTPTGGISGRGIRYHFTHQITGGRYVYPLGTGAAWPRPIPFTEVYLTCPERLAMQVNAPIEGKKLEWRAYNELAIAYPTYIAESAEARQTDFMLQRVGEKNLLSPQTSWLNGLHTQDASAWHIAYFQSNSDEDIRVQITKRRAPWRFAVADFFATSTVPLTTCVILYLLAWVITFRLVIRKSWQRAGSPGHLFGHGLLIFLKAQLFMPVIPIIVSLLILWCRIGMNALFIPAYISKADWVLLPFTAIIAGSLITAMVYYHRYATVDWRKWLTLSSWVCSALLFAAMSAALYGFLYWCETI